MARPKKAAPMPVGDSIIVRTGDHDEPKNHTRRYNNHRRPADGASDQMTQPEDNKTQRKDHDMSDRHRGTSFLASEPDNFARRSSPILSGDRSEASWQFETTNQQNQSLEHRSSPKSSSDNPVEATSVPDNAPVTNGSRAARSRFDFSETASTMLRSSPAGVGHSTQDVFEFLNQGTSPSSGLVNESLVAARVRHKQPAKRVYKARAKATECPAARESRSAARLSKDEVEVPVSPQIQVKAKTAAAVRVPKSRSAQQRVKQDAKSTLELDDEDRVPESTLKLGHKSSVSRKRARKKKPTTSKRKLDAADLSASDDSPDVSVVARAGNCAEKPPQAVTRAQAAKARRLLAGAKKGILNSMPNMMDTTEASQMCEMQQEDEASYASQACNANSSPFVSATPQECQKRKLVTISSGSKNGRRDMKRRLFGESDSSTSVCQNLELASDLPILQGPVDTGNARLPPNRTILNPCDPNGKPSRTVRRVSLSLTPLVLSGPEPFVEDDKLAATQGSHNFYISSSGSPVLRKSPLPYILTQTAPNMEQTTRQQKPDSVPKRIHNRTGKQALSFAGYSTGSLLKDLRAHFTEKGEEEEEARDGPVTEIQHICQKASEQLLAGQTAGEKLVDTYQTQLDRCIRKIEARHNIERDQIVHRLRVDRQNFVNATQKTLQKVTDRSREVEKQMRRLENDMETRRNAYIKATEAVEALRQRELHEKGAVEVGSCV